MKRFFMLFLAIIMVALVSAPSTSWAQEETPEPDGPSGELWDITGDIPNEVVPTKFENDEANPDSCTIPGACWMMAEAGVIGTNIWEESQENIEGGNPSAVFISPVTQSLIENDTAGLILPETGYMMVSGAEYNMSCGEFTISLTASADHVWFVVLRGLHDGPGDRNLICEFSNYTEGAVLVTMYQIERDASAFFSQQYLIDNVENAHHRDNCGASGCEMASVLILDVNDGSYTVLYRERDWEWDKVPFEIISTNTPLSDSE